MVYVLGDLSKVPLDLKPHKKVKQKIVPAASIQINSVFAFMDQRLFQIDDSEQSLRLQDLKS